ncbi:hypothetical protein VTK56DRAFT_6850 [Thermocarpiscus australiensis]
MRYPIGGLLFSIEATDVCSEREGQEGQAARAGRGLARSETRSSARPSAMIHSYAAGRGGGSCSSASWVSLRVLVLIGRTAEEARNRLGDCLAWADGAAASCPFLSVGYQLAGRMKARLLSSTNERLPLKTGSTFCACQNKYHHSQALPGAGSGREVWRCAAVSRFTSEPLSEKMGPLLG